MRADKNGFYGEFGGAFIPEMLRAPMEELKSAFNYYVVDLDFQSELLDLMQTYSGRPTPLFEAKNLSAKYGNRIFLKREDLNHTGAHKINNCLGQVLLAKRMGKRRVIAETGAGQHGVATATACALMGIDCEVFMGEVDIERQAPNVARMKMLGAKVIPAKSGSRTLKDATNEAIRYWINNPNTFYVIGSVVGPHPYPEMVAYFQSIISKEMKEQFADLGIQPNKIIACVGGGSNAAGAFYHYLDELTELIIAEAAGHGIDSGKSAATSILGTKGVIHGSMTYLMQDNDGQIIEPHSISAGLDYPGIGPIHAHLLENKRAKSFAITDTAALEAGRELCELEGIIPALESAHALAVLPKLSPQNEIIALNLSGRGDKDLATYIKHLS